MSLDVSGDDLLSEFRAKCTRPEPEPPWYRVLPDGSVGVSVLSWGDKSEHPIRALAARYDVPAWLLAAAADVLIRRGLSEPYERLAHGFERLAAVPGRVRAERG